MFSYIIGHRDSIPNPGPGPLSPNPTPSNPGFEFGFSILDENGEADDRVTESTGSLAVAERLRRRRRECVRYLLMPCVQMCWGKFSGVRN